MFYSSQLLCVYKVNAAERKQKGHSTKNRGKAGSILFLILTPLICLNTRNMEEEKSIPVFH